MAETEAKRSVSWHARPAVALAAVLGGFAAFNAVSALLWPPEDRSFFGFVPLGVLVLEPMLLGLWTALGEGSWLTRLPLAVLSFMLLLLAPAIHPGSFKDMELAEFVVTAIAGLAILSASALVLLVFRRLTGLRLISDASVRRPHNASNLQFSIIYLFVVTTLCAAVLGILSQIKFQPARPPGFMHGTDFFIAVMVIASSVSSAALLPTLSVPLLMLCGQPSKRALLGALAFWVTVSALILFFLFDADDPRVLIKVGLGTQVGGAVAGALTGRLLKSFGVRLTNG